MSTPDFTVQLLRADEYRRFKSVLNASVHPSFIGKNLFTRHTTNGGALVYRQKDRDVAVSLINTSTNVLLALSVAKSVQGQGLETTLIRFLNPNFARVIEPKMNFFLKAGYVRLGEPKLGRKFKTWIMVKRSLIGLAGRLQSLDQNGKRSA